MPNSRTEDPDGDLDSRAKIDQLVRRFYGEVALDDVLGPVFNDVAAVDWEAHIPKLTAFWRRALLGEAGYVGNPYREHARVHSQAAFEHRHFERWLELFEATIAGRWSGPNTDRALELVHNVARVHEAQLVAVTPRSSARSPVSTVGAPLASHEEQSSSEDESAAPRVRPPTTSGGTALGADPS